MSARDFSDSIKLVVIKENLEKNNGNILCEICGKKVSSISECHFDHIYPYAKGGTSTLSNCQILCNDCNLKKIVIVGSVTFYKEVLEWKERLEKLNYCVLDYPKKINIVTEYQENFETFYKNLDAADEILLLNLDKKGIEGYIGYESFAEFSYSVAKNIISNSNKNIYILKLPSKEVGCYDEINQFIKLGYIKIFNK